MFSLSNTLQAGNFTGGMGVVNSLGRAPKTGCAGNMVLIFQAKKQRVAPFFLLATLQVLEGDQRHLIV